MHWHLKMNQWVYPFIPPGGDRLPTKPPVKCQSNWYAYEVIDSPSIADARDCNLPLERRAFKRRRIKLRVAGCFSKKWMILRTSSTVVALPASLIKYKSPWNSSGLHHQIKRTRNFRPGGRQRQKTVSAKSARGHWHFWQNVSAKFCLLFITNICLAAGGNRQAQAMMGCFYLSLRPR